MRIRFEWIFAGLALAGGVGDANAQSLETTQNRIPAAAFFAGAGIGASFVNFGSQSVYNKGISTVYEGGVPVATGQADGPPVINPFKNKDAVVPQIQLGYFQRIGNDNWFLGGKLSYNYVGAQSSIQNLTIPQYGSSSSPGVTSFTGYSVTDLYKVSIQSQALMLAFIGRQFGDFMLYAGGGLSLTQKQGQLDNVVGYATINKVLVDISGAPQSVSSTNWTYGGAATAGFMYFFNQHLFLDVNYIYSGTAPHTTYIQSPFHNPGNGVWSTGGLLIGSYTENLSSQLVTASLNWAF